MKSRLKSTLTFLLRWGIAVVGVFYVISNITWFDRIQVIDPATGLPVKVRVVGDYSEKSESFTVLFPAGDGTEVEQMFPRTAVVARAEFLEVKLKDGRGEKAMHVLGQVVQGDGVKPDDWPLLCVEPRGLWDRYWNKFKPGVKPQLVLPSELASKPPPRGIDTVLLIEEGLQRRVTSANPLLLLIAMAIYPVVYLITTYRWWMLMRVVDAGIALRRTFAINMVGSFWNSFLLGSTGGDVIKAVYAARNSSHKTRAVVSVLVDRVIGLYGLIILGGLVALVQWTIHHEAGNEVGRRCGQVALASGFILVCTMIGLSIYYVPMLRKLFGVEFILSKMPMQKTVRSVRETLDLYGKHPWHVLAAVLMSLPVHGIVVTSVMIACVAFGLPIEWWYYWVIVPITVLSGAIPISPQGAGVMEGVAYVLMKSQGGTMTHVVVLTVCIRVIGILWNLAGGVFVLRGGYSKPKDAQHELEEDLETPDSADASRA
jgi:uncharacterized protein (TIRG00374 family)